MASTDATCMCSLAAFSSLARTFCDSAFSTPPSLAHVAALGCLLLCVLVLHARRHDTLSREREDARAAIWMGFWTSPFCEISSSFHRALVSDKDGR